MEPIEVRQWISHVKAVTDTALEACRRDEWCAQPLRESIAALDMDINAALQTVERTDDEARIVEVVDGLEACADRAKRAVRLAPRADERTVTAVLQAHDQLSRLKRQLH